MPGQMSPQTFTYDELFKLWESPLFHGFRGSHCPSCRKTANLPMGEKIWWCSCGKQVNLDPGQHSPMHYEPDFGPTRSVVLATRLGHSGFNLEEGLIRPHLSESALIELFSEPLTNFRGFTGEICGQCKKKANVLFGATRWTCYCGYKNTMLSGKPNDLYMEPQMGPFFRQIETACRRAETR